MRCQPPGESHSWGRRCWQDGEPQDEVREPRGGGLQDEAREHRWDGELRDGVREHRWDGEPGVREHRRDSRQREQRGPRAERDE